MSSESPADRADPWGAEEPPAVVDLPPLPPALAELAALDGPLVLPPGERFVHPRPVDLPEVRELLSAGWRVADRSPLWSFLPAVWPSALRCWVPDRLPYFSRSSPKDRPGSTVVIPWTPEVADDLRNHEAETLARIGLPPPPPGRIWLLRSPWPSVAVDVVRSLIHIRAAERGGGAMLDDVLVDSARELLAWDEDQVWAWWPGESGAVARAWRERGRVGEDAAAVIGARLAPDLVAGFDGGEKAALVWTAALGMNGAEALERATAWTALGLAPADVAEGLQRADPVEVAAWLEEDITLGEIRILYGLPLEEAKSWLAAGVPAARARQLLRADRELTVPEYQRFEELGIGGEEQLAWIEHGFDAGAALGWRNLDVLPNEARVWRAAGYDPTAAAPVVAAIPSGAPRIPTSGPGTRRGVWVSGPAGDRRPGDPLDLRDLSVRRSLHYSVDDPPGTRGSYARNRRRFPPPDS